jgi:hypothetical protein
MIPKYRQFQVTIVQTRRLLMQQSSHTFANSGGKLAGVLDFHCGVGSEVCAIGGVVNPSFQQQLPRNTCIKISRGQLKLNCKSGMNYILCQTIREIPFPLR